MEAGAKTNERGREGKKKKDFSLPVLGQSANTPELSGENADISRSLVEKNLDKLKWIRLVAGRQPVENSIEIITKPRTEKS